MSEFKKRQVEISTRHLPKKKRFGKTLEGVLKNFKGPRKIPR